MSYITIGKLKLISIIVPAIFIGAFEFIRHQYFHTVDNIWFNLLAVGLVGSSIYLFSHFIFRQIAVLQRDIVQRSMGLSALNKIIQAAGRSLNLDEVLKIITDKVLEVIPAIGGGIYLAQNGQLALRYQSGLSPELLATVIDTNDFSLTGCNAACQRAARGDVVKTSLGQEGGHCVFSPIRAKNQVLGVFCVVRDKPFDEWEIDFLTLVSQEIGFVVEHARLYSRVEELAVLEERDRIAKEIHDGLAQVLGYISLKSATAQQMLASQKLAETNIELKEIEKVAQEAYTDAREAILGLRTSVGIEGGLVHALREYITRVQRGSNLSIELDVEKGQQFGFLPATEVQLIRIIQEALTNVRKHARATEAVVRFRLSDGVARVSVEDNGHGFDVNTVINREGPHFGLQAMRERAERVGGIFRIESSPWKGTKVEVLLPLKTEEEKVEVPQSIISR